MTAWWWPFDAAHGSQCGRSRSILVTVEQPPGQPGSRTSSCSVTAHRYGSSASRSRLYSTRWGDSESRIRSLRLPGGGGELLEHAGG
jgi:hypothetical protein